MKLLGGVDGKNPLVSMTIGDRHPKNESLEKEWAVHSEEECTAMCVRGSSEAGEAAIHEPIALAVGDLDVLEEVLDLLLGARDRLRSVLGLGDPLLDEGEQESLDRLLAAAAGYEQKNEVRHQSAALVVREPSRRHVDEVELLTLRGDELLLQLEDVRLIATGDHLEGTVGVVDALERVLPVDLVGAPLVVLPTLAAHAVSDLIAHEDEVSLLLGDLPEVQVRSAQEGALDRFGQVAAVGVSDLVDRSAQDLHAPLAGDRVVGLLHQLITVGVIAEEDDGDRAPGGQCGQDGVQVGSALSDGPGDQLVRRRMVDQQDGELFSLLRRSSDAVSRETGVDFDLLGLHRLGALAGGFARRTFCVFAHTSLSLLLGATADRRVFRIDVTGALRSGTVIVVVSTAHYEAFL